MTKDDVHGVNGISADRFLQVWRLGRGASCQDLVQHVPADQRHKSDGDFKWAVFPTVTWKGDIQVDLKRKTRVSVACRSMVKDMFLQATLNITLTLDKHIQTYNKDKCVLSFRVFAVQSHPSRGYR